MQSSRPFWAVPRGVFTLLEGNLLLPCLRQGSHSRRCVVKSQSGSSRWGRLHRCKEAPNFSRSWCSNGGRSIAWRLRVYEDPLQDALYNTWGEAEDDWGLEEFTDEQLIDVLYEVGC